jgi:hypothetical protein
MGSVSDAWHPVLVTHEISRVLKFCADAQSVGVPFAKKEEGEREGLDTISEK